MSEPEKLYTEIDYLEVVYDQEDVFCEELNQEDILEQENTEPPPKKRKRTFKPTKRNYETEIKLALCAEIRKYPCLYQITNKDYSNKIAKDAIWHQISSTVSSSLNRSVTVLECRKHWDALRESTRIYLDKAKINKIADKSGAPADMLDLYQADGSQRFDIYQERWPLAEAMSFFLPSCARNAFTISIGDCNSKTTLKKSLELEEEVLLEENESFTVPATPTSRNRNRSYKNGNSDELLDETLCSVASSLSKLVDSRSSTEDGTQLKFKEFHVELDKILRQMPFMHGMQFCMDMVKRANETIDNLKHP
ncbi:uncharacterized protein LOC131690762 [Topomyia yanbarensis]|uniref:uncharacterized protein LOC131690761 n=1 Tax=Topomyia yanbarensis TaxID=2498891 RepID=UPI00273B2995|nr:uncharacterized protein LOC131690761 [Topomyia yanbarensis]XP_058832736.1 uncharacterized protein LOC131690762 [Topomyia yanbarensis]